MSNKKYHFTNIIKYGVTFSIISLAINAAIISISLTQKLKHETIILIALSIFMSFTCIGLGVGYKKDQAKLEQEHSKSDDKPSNVQYVTARFKEQIKSGKYDDVMNRPNVDLVTNYNSLSKKYDATLKSFEGHAAKYKDSNVTAKPDEGLIVYFKKLSNQHNTIAHRHNPRSTDLSQDFEKLTTNYNTLKSHLDNLLMKYEQNTHKTDQKIKGSNIGDGDIFSNQFEKDIEWSDRGYESSDEFDEEKHDTIDQTINTYKKQSEQYYEDIGILEELVHSCLDNTSKEYQEYQEAIVMLKEPNQTYEECKNNNEIVLELIEGLVKNQDNIKSSSSLTEVKECRDMQKRSIT